MHELSIAQALMDLADRHVPPGAALRRLVVQIGILQAIDPGAMQWAWRAATSGGAHEQAELELEYLPGTMRCMDCGREWQDDRIDVRCACGSSSTVPRGGDELTLLSIEVDEPLNSEGFSSSSARSPERREPEQETGRWTSR